MLKECLNKYKVSVREVNPDFDNECFLTDENFGVISLDKFNVSNLFDTEKIGCNGWKQLVEN